MFCSNQVKWLSKTFVLPPSTCSLASPSGSGLMGPAVRVIQFTYALIWIMYP